MTRDEALTYLIAKAEQAKGPWTPYDYPAWASAVEEEAERFLEYQDDEEVEDALVRMAENLKKSRRSIFDGESKPDPEGELVMLREIQEAPATHFWLWPEKL